MPRQGHAQGRRIYADFTLVLIHSTRKLYQDDQFGVELDQTIYALDSTTVAFCLTPVSLGTVSHDKRSSKAPYFTGFTREHTSYIKITTGKVFQAMRGLLN